MRLLFQGDSVTDASRTDPENYSIDKENLGNGYPLIISGLLNENKINATVQNRGISGNRTIDLVNRWQADCIDLAPDYLTILIGINDCWRKYDSNDETPIERFYENYERILSEAKNKTQARIIMMEPFVLPNPPDRKEWRKTLDPMIHATRELAAKYSEGFIPLDGILNKAAIDYGCEKIAADGVHPTLLGHQIIADVWLSEFIKNIK